MQLFYQPLVIYLFMGGVLINYKKLIIQLDEPVGLKELAYYTVPGKRLL